MRLGRTCLTFPVPIPDEEKFCLKKFYECFKDLHTTHCAFTEETLNGKLHFLCSDILSHPKEV